MIDVLEQIKPLLEFQSSDDYYFLQILRRKKDNDDNTSNSRVIKSYYINSVDYLESHYQEIKDLCNFFNARAGLRLNKRSYKKTSLMAIEIMIKNGIMEGWEFSKRAYDSSAGKHHNDKNKKWIVDLDGNPSDEYIQNIIDTINSCDQQNELKILTVLETKTGIHLITKPFNVKQFNDEYPNIDIHKDNPINLYIP